ncbi:MAG TPA: hypothetical protein VM677_12810 [Actinokineospora sp.]|jgi:hypothetical protein|nr:hypothetical protein [Actinokineospora sp.]
MTEVDDDGVPLTGSGRTLARKSWRARALAVSGVPAGALVGWGLKGGDHVLWLAGIFLVLGQGVAWLFYRHDLRRFGP